jgi:hypothetical protein
MRQVFLQSAPFLALLFGVIHWIGTLIEQRKHVVKSTALERTADGLFLASMSILCLLMWPWASVGNRPRYAMYAGVAMLVAHTVVAAARAYRAGKLLPQRSGAWIASGSNVLLSLACLLAIGHVLLAPFPNDQILIAFPLGGKWSVGEGGASVLTNGHIRYADQRYALDLVKVGPDGKCFTGDGRELEEHYSWRQPVRAPLSGTVIEAVKTYPDNELGKVDRRDSRGNHVVIRSAAGEAVLLAHLRIGSLLVEKGDSVHEGQLIAEVGNSGNTSAPHLHIDASRATERGTVSVPIVFKDIGAGLRTQRRGATLGFSLIR